MRVVLALVAPCFLMGADLWSISGDHPERGDRKTASMFSAKLFRVDASKPVYPGHRRHAESVPSTCTLQNLCRMIPDSNRFWRWKSHIGHQKGPYTTHLSRFSFDSCTFLAHSLTEVHIKSVNCISAYVLPVWLYSVLPRLFTWNELEVLVCGEPEIDVDLLQKHTRYKYGVSSAFLVACEA